MILLLDQGLFVINTLLLLKAFQLVDTKHVTHTGVKGFLIETGLVLEADSHVGTESGNLEEVHLWLSYDLGHYKVIGQLFAFI